MKERNQFWVAYTEHNDPCLRSFKTVEERTNWIGYFTLQHLSNRSDNWIDYIFTGVPEVIGSEIKVFDESITDYSELFETPQNEAPGETL